MSLVIALAASREAVIGADRRAIAFLGPCPELEEELYSGQIKNDQELADRARELGASLQISDGREKVWRRGDLLVGEVTEISAQALPAQENLPCSRSQSAGRHHERGRWQTQRMQARKAQAARRGSEPGTAWDA